MATKWSHIKHKGEVKPEHKAALERRYNRLWWRLVRFWDRLRGR